LFGIQLRKKQGFSKLKKFHAELAKMKAQRRVAGCQNAAIAVFLTFAARKYS
jgi:hypothetical protein